MKRETWRALSLRQRVQWILQYYGVAIAVAAVALVAAASFLTSALGPGESYAAKVMILDDRQSADNCQVFARELSERLGGACEVTCYAPSAMYEMQAFAVRLTSDELDVIIAPGVQMRELRQNGYLRETEELSPNSRYQTVTRGGAADGDIFIGVAVRSEGDAGASRAMRYFTEPEDESQPDGIEG